MTNCRCCEKEGKVSDTRKVPAPTRTLTLEHRPGHTYAFYLCARGHEWLETTDPRYADNSRRRA